MFCNKLTFDTRDHCNISISIFREIHSSLSSLNPFLINAPILYPLKTPENQRFSDVFRGYKIGTLARNGLIIKAQLNLLQVNILYPLKTTETKGFL